MRVESDQAWASGMVQPLPSRWQRRIMRAWEKQRGQGQDLDRCRFANIELRETVAALGRVRISLDASDIEICTRAEKMADRCMGSGQLWGGQFAHDIRNVRQAMAAFCEGQGIEPPTYRWLLDREGSGTHVEDRPAIARMTDPAWWRRALRKQHAQQVEGAAIRLGIVHKQHDCYISDESLQRRIEQNRRNAAALEATLAINELGQQYTLAELAAKGTANKAIRRAELMTRISGFERIARDLGHAGLFFTITCPSRMHKWRTVAGGRVVENARYDGTTPREAQAYLAKVWARIRAALKRKEVGIYGFRITEPNHDGTPHWHLLVFHGPDRLADLRAVVMEHALRDSPTERGAHAHRVDFKPIDCSRGSAAGYIAKYVAKNIDGYRVEQDLYGNDALETSARVEAWAATWGIRQFQQVGGPPVTVWRELRRVEAVPEQAPQHLKDAHAAVNKLAVIEGRENASVAWDRYCKAQGGVFVGRAYRIRISRAEVEGVGRYGEPLGAKPVGVETVSRELYTPEHMAWMGGKAERLVHWFVESVRHAWEIVSRAGRTMGGQMRGIAAPWTRVNNCTEGMSHDGDRETRESNSGGAGAVGWRAGPCESDGGCVRIAIT